MGGKSIRTVGVFCAISLFLLLSLGSPMVNGKQPVDYEMIMVLKGGIGGALALIDTYYTGNCFGMPNDFVPARIHLQVQGRFVFLNGETNQIMPGRTRGWVRSGPVFGFGPALITCEMYSTDSLSRLFASRTKTAFLLGPFVIGLL